MSVIVRSLAITLWLMFGSQLAIAGPPKLDGKPVLHPVWHHLIMPGDTVDIGLDDGAVARLNGELLDDRWTAPSSPGHHELHVLNAAQELTHKITLFVLQPASAIDKNGYLGEFRVGKYPKNRPKGFIRLNPEDMNTPISPNFTVGQFICKQQPNHWPKYVLVAPSNLQRLETLLASLNRDGITDAKSLFVMSGFRTPFYNTAIGSAKFSRHMYGDAADVYVDVEPADGVMDDLNKDGKVNKADADFFYDYAQKLFGKKAVKKGGLGSYRANAAHGPFVHVDARGNVARWGR